MLPRALRRRQDLRHAQNTAQQLQQPWARPALRSSHTTYTRTDHRPITPRPRLERSVSAASISTHQARQASADPVNAFYRMPLPQNDYTPFDAANMPSGLTSTSPLGQELSNLLMLDHSPRPGAVDPNTVGKPKNKQMRGSADEIETTLDACLQINRWDRSKELLAQLTHLYAGNNVELQRIHNKVLEAMVYDHIFTRSPDNVTLINGWVENTMGKRRIPPNAQTFAIKIKAALATLLGGKRDRTVRRYWQMAKEYNVVWEVASLREILSDSDLGKLSEICPLEPDEPDSATIQDALLGEQEDSILAVESDAVAQQPLEKIKETDMSGPGMKAVRESLAVFQDEALADAVAPLSLAEQQARAQDRQRRLERDSLNAAISRWQTSATDLAKKVGQIAGAASKQYSWEWYTSTLQSIEQEMVEVEVAEKATVPTQAQRLRQEYGPFLSLLSPSSLSAITVTTIMQLVARSGMSKSIKISSVVMEVGYAVEHEVVFKREQRFKDMPNLTSRPRRRFGKNLGWSAAQTAKVGSVLCELFFANAKVTSNQGNAKKTAVAQLAFQKSVAWQAGRRSAIVTVHPELIKALSTAPASDYIVKHLPMVCPPRPWTNFDDGAYLESKSVVLRYKQSDYAQQLYTQAAAARGDLSQLFKGLNVLGSTGWKINLDVLKVMTDAWNTGEKIANLPPTSVEMADLVEPGPDATPKERYHHYRDVMAQNNLKSGYHSNRCFMNFQMETARAFANEPFYLPHNVDFRGRAYPIPPYLNQMGADNARGLLMFEKGRELGPQGLKWLKVHLANVCGYDKASLSDRAKFADEHMADVRDAVDNPLNGNRWWLKADDPWQCLATCFELVRAFDSGNPETYVSHMPIHQDGTCNGLQHYAALGGDIAGARQVNLEPGDKPADVYTGVAELVRAEIKKDAEQGVEIAKLLDDRITRKIVKQTVMTNVYGVTFIGAVEQVKKQVNDLLPDLQKSNMDSEASRYIAKKIFKGLGSLFEGAHDIQYWFGDCANRITNSISLAQLDEAAKQIKAGTERKAGPRKVENTMPERQEVGFDDFRSTVVWTTPLKLPVVQPYRVQRATSIKTHLSTFTITEPTTADAVDRRKQLQAFPPNFVHSLDATHMLLSAIKANEEGITFSAVHDSFWSHAADIDRLSVLLRECFIRMHSEDIVGRLAAEFEKRYQGHIYLAKVERKSDLAKELREFRSNTTLEQMREFLPGLNAGKKISDKRRQFYELMLEHKRQTLLKSSDLVEVEKGSNMVTPASLFEKYASDDMLKGKNSLGETALGHVPESSTTPSEGVVDAAISNESDVDMTATLEPLIEPKKEPRNVLGIVDRNRPSRKQAAKPEWLWLPLTFKAVPKKGDWDVRRLKDSVYFFS